MADSGAPLIREAREGDLPRLLVLLDQLAQQGQRQEETFAPVTEQHRKTLRELTADRNVALLVLEHQGEVQGACVLYILANLSHGSRPFGLVENVVVDEAARGRGHGGLLMAEAVRRATERGCYKVVLLSNLRRTDAHRFYARIGFSNSHKGFSLYREAH